MRTKKVRRDLKKLYKELKPYRPEHKPDVLINAFSVSRYQTGESWYNVYLLKNTPAAMEWIEENIALEGYEHLADYSPTGRPFARPAEIKKFPERIAVVQWCGLDV